MKWPSRSVFAVLLLLPLYNVLPAQAYVHYDAGLMRNFSKHDPGFDQLSNRRWTFTTTGVNYSGDTGMTPKFGSSTDTKHFRWLAVTAAQTGRIVTNDSPSNNYISVSAGDPFRFGHWHGSSSADLWPQTDMQVLWYDSDNILISTETSALFTIAAASTWYYDSHQTTAPERARNAIVRLRAVTGGNTARTILFDGVDVHPTGTAVNAFWPIAPTFAALGDTSHLISNRMPTGFARKTRVGYAAGAEFKMATSGWASDWGGGYWITSYDTFWTLPAGGGNGQLQGGLAVTDYVTVVSKVAPDGVFGFMKTSSYPIHIRTASDAAATHSNISGDSAVTINITLNLPKSAEEKVYVRYTTDTWTTSNFLKATGADTAYSVAIPGQTSPTTVSYYAMTSTADTPSGLIHARADYVTLSVENNSGSNYTYTASTNNPMTSWHIPQNDEPNNDTASYMRFTPAGDTMWPRRRTTDNPIQFWAGKFPIDTTDTAFVKLYTCTALGVWSSAVYPTETRTANSNQYHRFLFSQASSADYDLGDTVAYYFEVTKSGSPTSYIYSNSGTVDNTSASESTVTLSTARSLPFIYKIRSTKPVAPTIAVSPIDGAANVTSRRPTISWNAATDVDTPSGDTISSYYFEIDDNADMSSPIAAESGWKGSASSNTILTNLSLNAPYYWRIAAKDTYGLISDSSATFSFTVTGGFRTVNGDIADWSTQVVSAVDTSIVADSEFIWRANTGDVRTDGDNPDDNYDLSRFAVTADTSNIYFLATMVDINPTSLPIVAVAIDADRVSGSGNQEFGGLSGTGVADSAFPEMHLLTSITRTGYWTTNFSAFNIRGDGWIESADTSNAFEFSMPWSEIGVTLPNIVRFSVITGQDEAGNFKQVGVPPSKSLDGITTSDRKSGGNWYTEVTSPDTLVGYYFDVDFDTNGRVVLNRLDLACTTSMRTEETFTITVKAVDYNGNICPASWGDIVFSHNGAGALRLVDTSGWVSGTRVYSFTHSRTETITITAREPRNGKTGSVVLPVDAIPVVRISEIGIGFSGTTDSNFVELFIMDDKNDGLGADLTDWRIYTTTTGNPGLRKTFSALNVKESSFVTLYFAAAASGEATDGADSRAIIQTASSNATIDASEGIIYLLSDRAFDTRDVVAYSNQSSLTANTSALLTDLVAKGHWSPDATAANTASSSGLAQDGNSLRRSGGFVDGNVSGDWSLDSQTPGNYPLSRFALTTDSAAPYYNADSFTLTAYAIDGRNDTIIGARFRPTITIDAGTIVPTRALFIKDHTDFNSGDTAISVGVSGTTGTRVITFAAGAVSESVTVDVQSIHQSMALTAPMQVTRDANFSLRVRAINDVGGTYTGFTGVVNLTVNKGTITPSSRTYIAADAGDSTFSVAVSGATTVTITATGNTKTGTAAVIPLLDTHFYISEYLGNDSDMPEASGTDRDEFIEFRNNGYAARAITGYTLLIAADVPTVTSTYTFPALSVPAGRFVVVHLNKAGTDDLSFSDTDGAAHLYGLNSSPAMSDTCDVIPNVSTKFPFSLSLYASSTQDSSTIVDFVGVDATTADSTLWDTDAVNAGIWTNNACLDISSTAADNVGRPQYRITDGVDSNGITSAEWSLIATGGGTTPSRYTEGCTNVNAQPGGVVTLALITSSSPTGDTFVAGDALHITLTSTTDGDANARNSTNVKVYSDTDPQGILVTLIETANNSMTFIGSASAAGTPLESNDGMRIVKAAPGETLTVEWIVSSTVKTSSAQVGPLDHFTLTPAVTSFNEGDQIDITAAAKDAGNFTKTTFTGAVTITSSASDSNAVYPSTWNFAAADNGETIIKVRFGAGPGSFTCTVTSGTKTGTTTFTVLADTNYLINEVLPNVGAAIDWNASTVIGDNDEWVEIFNKGTSTLPLTGYGLRPAGSANCITLQGSILPKGYVTVYRGTSGTGKSQHYDSMGIAADTKTALAGNWSSSLTDGGGTVELLAASDSAVIASVTYPSFTGLDDRTYGRGPDGRNSWYTYTTPSPGSHLTASPNNVTSMNATFNVHAPATASVGNAFTLRTALLSRAGDTLTSFSDTADLFSVVTGVVSPTSITFSGGVATTSVTYSSGTTNETSGLYVRIQGGISGNDSVLIVDGTPNAETSQVNVEQAIADGVDTALVQVIALSAAGTPISSATVTITSSKGATDTISPASMVTDVNGACTFTVRSLSTTASLITVTAGGVVLNDSPTIFWLDPAESGVSTTFGVQSTLLSSDATGHMILFPVWRHDGKALAYIAKTAAVDTWNVYAVYDDGNHGDGAANDGVFSSSYRLTGAAQNVFEGSKVAWSDILKADGTRCATAVAGDGASDIIFSSRGATNVRDLYAVRAEAQDSALLRESTVQLTSGSGTWSMPVTISNADAAMYAIYQGSLYRITGKGTVPTGPGGGGDKILEGGSATDFMIGTIPYAVVDLAMYSSDVMALTMLNNKIGHLHKNKRSQVILVSGLASAGYRQWTAVGTATCKLVNRPDSMVAWNISWDVGGRALSWARDITGNFVWLKAWNRATNPEDAYVGTDFDLEVIYVSDTLATYAPTSLISNKKGLNDLSATFSPGATARVAYASYDATAATVKLNVVDIDGVTEVNTSGGLLFQNGRVTAIIDEGDLLSGSVQITVAQPTSAPANPTPESIAITGNAHEFSPAGTTFDDSITVIIYYDAADLTAAGVTNGTAGEYTLRVYWYNPTLSLWQDYNAIVDPTDRLGALGTLTFQTGHFSVYGVGFEQEHPNRPDPLAPGQGAAISNPHPTLSWKHNDPRNRNQTAFKVEVAIDSSFGSLILSEERSTADTTVVLSTPLPAGDSILYWRVRTAAVSNGFGAWSNGDSFLQTHISTPLLLSPSDATETRISTPRFSWSHRDADSDPQVSFRLELAPDTAFDARTISYQQDTSAENTIYPSGLAEGVYYWRVKTADAGSFGPWSGARKLTISAKPNAPTILSAADSISIPGPTIRWSHNDPHGAPQTGFRVRLGTDSGLTSTLLDFSASSGETSVTLHGETELLLVGTHQVYFRISTAADGLNFGPEASGAFLARLNPPSAPTVLEPSHGAVASQNTPLVFRWSQNDSESDPQKGYKLVIARDSNFMNIIFNEALFLSAESRAVSGLSGGTYYWHVATRDQVGLGAWSPTRTLIMDTRASVPQLLSPITNEAIGTPQPAFHWRHIDPQGSPQTSALLEISRTPSFDTIWVSRVSSGPAQTFTLDAADSLFLVGETTVHWRVRTASIGTDFGPPSADSSFVLTLNTSTAPALLSPADGIVTRNAELSFSWNHVSAAGLGQTSFEIEIGTDSGFGQSVRHHGRDEKEIFVAVDDVRKRHWRVRTADVMGWSPWSATRSYNAPVWSAAPLVSTNRVPARDTVAITIQFLTETGTPTDRSGGAQISIGGKNFGAGRAALSGSMTDLSIRIDTPGVYPIVVTEENRTSRDTLYVMARSYALDTYLIVSGRSGVGQRILADDTSLNVMLKIAAPDSALRLRVTNLWDTTLIALIAPTAIDSNIARWENLAINLSGNRKIRILAYRNADLVASEFAFVLAKPSQGARFAESETAAASVSIDMPANSIDTPVWIEVRRTVSDASVETASRSAQARGRKFLAGTAMEIAAEDIDGNTIERFTRDLTLRFPTVGGNALKIMFLENGEWVEVNATSYDSATGEAVAQSNHLSVWGLSVGLPGAGSVQSARIYPNPWRSDGPTSSLASSNAAYGVKFDQLPSEAVRFRIFTIAGEIVLDGTLSPSSLGATAANGHLQVVDVGGATGQVARWDLKNANGRDVASGVYIIVLEGPGGKATRKLAIIR